MPISGERIRKDSQTQCPILDSKQINTCNIGITNYTGYKDFKITSWDVVNYCLSCPMNECILVIKDEAKHKRSLSPM